MSKPETKRPDFETLGAAWTAREISQQPETLREVHAMLLAREDVLGAFLEPLLGRADLRVILAGAGTSAFIGECLAAYLSRWLGRPVEAIATTDIVASPALYLDRDEPTLLVSFGRSGASPESLATAALVDQIVAEAHHLVITCNGEGALARFARGHDRALALVLPDATHDRSFAMTSSFSGMMYAALAALCGVGAMRGRIDAIAGSVAGVLADHDARLRALAARRYERIVYLGANGLKGLAREAALKLLEMTDGTAVTLWDSPLGFRHGPKASLTAETLVIVLVSNDPQARKYDLDLLAELKAEGSAGAVVAVTTCPLVGLDGVEQMVVRHLEDARDEDLLFAYIVIGQLLAFHQSLALGKSPDNPNPSGIVNRVVKGVQIHAFD